MSIFDGIGSLREGFDEALPMISAGAQAFGGFAAKTNANEEAKDIQRLSAREAQRTLLAGKIEAQQIVSQGLKTVALAQARVGGSGFQLRGSTLDVIAQSYANIEIDRLNTIYNSRREAALIQERGANAAKATKTEGTASLTRGLGAAALTLSSSGLFASKEGV